MVHVLLPYAVLPIYAALLRIDPALLRASEGLGAGRITTFVRVLLPLSAHGVATAAAFLFLLSLGFFVTPALLGGSADITIPMLIDSFVDERLDWPLAAAASMLLLAVTLALVGAGGPLRRPRRHCRGAVMAPAHRPACRGRAAGGVSRAAGAGDRARRVQRAFLSAPAAGGLVAALVGHLLRRPVLAATRWRPAWCWPC